MNETDLAQVHPKLRGLYDFWNDSRGDAEAPVSQVIDPASLVNWLPNTLIISCMATPSGVREYVYRYYGTAFEKAFGVDMEGKNIKNLQKEQQDLIRREYDRTCERKRPTWRLYSGEFKGKLVTWERLILPFVKSPDEDVSYLLVGAYESNADGMFVLEENGEMSRVVDPFAVQPITLDAIFAGEVA